MTKTRRIAIPPLPSAPCQQIQVCAAIKTSDRKLLQRFKRLDKREAILAKIVAERDEFYVTCWGGNITDLGRHLHVNVARGSYFSRQPKIKNKIEEVEQVLEEFYGQKFHVSIIGRYLVPTKKLPEGSFIRAMMLPEISKNNYVIKQLGAAFSLNNAPFNQVQWRITDRGEVAIQFDSGAKLRLDEAYFSSIYNVMDSSFRFVTLVPGSK